MEELIMRIRASGVPVWTKAECFDQMRGSDRTFLGCGCQGSATLFRSESFAWVVKKLHSYARVSMLTEVQVLLSVRGLPGHQQILGVCIEEDYLIISEYAGVTLRYCVEKGFLGEEHMKELERQIATALHKLHEVGFTHNDAFIDNYCVCFSEKGFTTTIIDYGHSLLAARNRIQDDFSNIKTMFRELRIKMKE